jgi:hypothetical protein
MQDGSAAPAARPDRAAAGTSEVLRYGVWGPVSIGAAGSFTHSPSDPS